MKTVLFVLGVVFCYLSGLSQDTGTFTDTRDGKIYKTVKIGNSWVMAENFAFKPVDGKYWVYKNNDDNIKKYGYLYDWKTANEIAPQGWHLPNIQEWKEVFDYLGGDYYAVRDALLEGGKSGFNLKYAGIRKFIGGYILVNKGAVFCTQSSSSTNLQVQVGLELMSGGSEVGVWFYYNESGINRKRYFVDWPKGTGASVRYFKNK